MRLWDVDTGQQIGAPLTGHADGPCVAFSADGHRVVSGAYDKTVRLWNADADRSVSDPFVGHVDKVDGVAFSPDGQRLASASWDHTIRLWPTEAAPKMLCDKLATNMSHKQWRDWVSPDISYHTLCPGLPIAADSSGGA